MLQPRVQGALGNARFLATSEGSKIVEQQSFGTIQCNPFNRMHHLGIQSLPAATQPVGGIRWQCFCRQPLTIRTRQMLTTSWPQGALASMAPCYIQFLEALPPLGKMPPALPPCPQALQPCCQQGGSADSCIRGTWVRLQPATCQQDVHRFQSSSRSLFGTLIFYVHTYEMLHVGEQQLPGQPSKTASVRDGR